MKTAISTVNAAQPTSPTAGAASTACSTAAAASAARASRRGGLSRTAARDSSTAQRSRNAASPAPATHAPARMTEGETPPRDICWRSAASPSTQCVSPSATAPHATATAATAATLRLPRFTPRTLLLGNAGGNPTGSLLGHGAKNL
ncbi:hypothetical protein [Streptomyces marincola]|uniref:hypothetical protein n=1 Tax=Streptomyces marincola TaxID=2878388 RepID=UPI001CF1292D|nr:hypothetical protein [Streptomyces marincola]UCM90022.1 hypothetical protein LC193_19880 [Streptomyces marincola]